MLHTNQCNNILCHIFCKHFTTNSKFFIVLLFFLCSFECIRSQNLNVQYTPGDHNGFLKDDSNELQNPQVTNDKLIKSQNLKFLEEGATNQQDSVMAVSKEKKVDLTIPRDYNYFLYDAEPYLPEADTRVRRTPFARKKLSRPIQQHIHKPRPYIATTEKIANNDDEDDEDEIVGELETYDEEKADEDEEDEENEKDEDNEDYDDQGHDCETSERCKETEPCETTESCETTELCETTSEECTDTPTECATEEITTSCPEK